MTTPLLRGRMAACLFALGTLLAGAVRAEDMAYPDTEPGQHARAYFTAFAAGEDAMRAFWETHGSAKSLADRPVAARLQVWRQMQSDMGTLTPVRVMGSGTDFVEVEARDRVGEPVTIRFMCESEAPHGLIALQIERGEGSGGGGGAPPAGPESGAPPGARRLEFSPAVQGPPPSDANIVAGLSAELDSLSRAGAFSGAVLFEKDGRPLFQHAYGMASRSEKRPNSLDTRFNLGSINKIFTHTAILQLAQQGKLALDSTVDRYLPDYPREKASRITIRQLLEHRGGVPDVFNETYDRVGPDHVKTMHDWFMVIRDEPLRFDPGTKQEYSNGGFVLLGAIIEKLSGEDYYDYVRDHIYRPAGMSATSHLTKDEGLAERAMGYTTNPDRPFRRGGGPGSALGAAPGAGPGGRGGPGGPGGAAGGPGGAPAELDHPVENTPDLPGRGSPAGGGYSTVGDLARFARALREGRLLDPEHTRLLPGGGSSFGIAGGSPGVNGLLEMAGPYTLVVLANVDPPAAEQFAKTTGRQVRRAAGEPMTTRRSVGAPGAGH